LIVGLISVETRGVAALLTMRDREFLIRLEG
jgi:hypothetical protein